MNESRERLFWVIALTLSITAHAAFVLLMPGAAVKPEIKPIMRVRLAMAEKKIATAPVPIREEVPAEKKAVPKKETVTKKQPQKKFETAFVFVKENLVCNFCAHFFSFEFLGL